MRVGIVGAGRMGDRHADAYRHIMGVELAGFADIDTERSAKLASKYGGKTYGSIAELLEDKSIDAVNICTPNPLHAENSLFALKKGKHVLVEKPMATILSDCDLMINGAKKAGLSLMVGHTYRFYPSSIRVKELLSAGEIGSVRLVFNYGLDPGQIAGKGATPEWALKKETGGGVFFDTIHAVDKLRYWLSDEVSSVYVPLMDRIDDSATAEQMGMATLVFRNGAVATLMPVSPTWGVRDTGCKIIGKKGALYVTYGEEVKVGKKDWVQHSFPHQAQKTTYEHNLQGFVNELSEFLSSIKEKRQPSVSGEEGKKNLAVVLAMYESFERKKVIFI